MTNFDSKTGKNAKHLKMSKYSTKILTNRKICKDIMQNIIFNLNYLYHKTRS